EDLTGLVVSLAAPGDFTFTQPAVTTLAPGATTTFTATFSPVLLGSHTATLRIASSDFDENPFDIALSGAGVGSLRDNYANRLNLGNAATVEVIGSNRNATIEPGENTFGGITGATVWADWTAPTTGWVTINTVDSPLDTQIGLYTGGGTLAGLSLIGYNDDSRRPTDLDYFGNPYNVSRLVFVAQAGTTYTISVGGHYQGSQETGTFELHIAPEPAPPVRVMGVTFTPNSADVTSAAQPATMQLSVDSNSALFPDSYLDVTVIRPDSGQYGSGLYANFQDSDRVSGTNTSGIYEQLVTIPRYIPGGAWPVRVSAWSVLGDGDYTWSTQGADLLEDFYLIPPPANAPLPVTNTGAVDSTAPTLVSITGVPPVVDVTTGDVTFDVDITFTDGLSGFTEAYFSATNNLFGNGVYYSSFGTIVSGDEFSGVYRQTVTIYQGSQSGTYYPVITLNDTALNQSYYSDYGGYGERFSAPGSDLTFQIIGVEPEIEVEAPGGGALTDGGPGFDFGSASVAMTAASYDFSGSFSGAFSQHLNEGTGTAVQSGGALRYHAADWPDESNAAFIHRDFQPTYNQSWSTEATVSIPLSLDGTLPSYHSWIDNGLTVGFTDTAGRVFHVTVALSLEPERKYLCFYSVTDTDGSSYEINTGTDVATTDESGVVRLKFDATTKTLTAETDTNTIFRLDLNLAGWGMTASDTFAIATSFSNSGCTIPEVTPITIDDFHAAITEPTAEQTFTITNTGVGNLYGLQLTKDGLNDADFTLSDLSTTFLMTGQSTTFTVSFSPKGAGAREATLHILSNDADENPFDIELTGNGSSSAPTVITQPATGLSLSTATLNGLVNSNGSSTSVSFDFGPDTNYGSSIIATPASTSSSLDTAINAVLTGMIPGTTWHYRVRATNSDDTTLGADR
ncbi:MAG: choice-of-anchor D domain-containing protein, partial [Prosthecobacter sp.]